MASLSATVMVRQGEALLSRGEAHAGIALLEEVQATFETAKAAKAARVARPHIRRLAADPRSALGVGPRATRKEIKTKYRKLALKYHPDKNRFTEDLFKIISTAYDAIKDQATPAKAAPRRQHGHYTRYSAQQQQQQQKHRGAGQYQSHSEHTRNEAKRQYEKYKQQRRAQRQPGAAGQYPTKPQAPRPSRHAGNAGAHKHHRHRRRRESGEHHVPSGGDYDKENAENYAHGQRKHAPKRTKKKSQQHRSKPGDDATRAAEAAMNDFWNGGGKNFPFKFCREHPKAAADMFARMFKKGGTNGGMDMPSYENATYEAFKAAFDKRGYGTHGAGANGSAAGPRKAHRRPDPGPTVPAPVQNVRVLQGQIRAESVALMWKAAEGAVCYELFYRRTRDRAWTSSSDTLRTSACRKNNLLPGTH